MDTSLRWYDNGCFSLTTHDSRLPLDHPRKITTLIFMTNSTAKIYQPAKTAMQSGRGKTHHWLLEYEKPAAGTPDALMGWNSMPDTITQVKLRFATRDEAIAYATAKKLEYSVSDPKKAVVRPVHQPLAAIGSPAAVPHAQMLDHISFPRANCRRDMAARLCKA